MEEKNETKYQENDSLEKLLKKQLFYTRIFAVSNVILVAAVLLIAGKVIPGLTRTLDQASDTLVTAAEMLEEASDTMVLAENALTSIQPVLDDFGGLTDNVNELVDSSSEAIETTMNKVNKMDIEKLNQAIQDLSDVVEPLAKFFKRF